MTTPFQSMAAFEAAIAVVPREDAERIRATFVEKRLDQQYAEQAAEALRLHQFSDGLAYTGYLWDFLVDKHVVTEEEVWDGVGPAPEIYAMWDLHSAERIRTPDYFRFPKGTVLRTDPATLRGGIDYLPEDLYIFDATCSWAAALTHECVDERRFCIWSGERVGATMAGGAQNQSP